MFLALLLFLTALLAGFIDAIAGGGGLLTLPAIMLTGVDRPHALGTNKGQSAFGTFTSLIRFFHSPLLDRRRAARSFIPALAGAALGVQAVSALPDRIVTPVVMTLLFAVAIFMLVHRPPASHEPPRHRPALLAIAVAFALAFYDGFFGPGTGTFLILLYAWLWRDPLDAASANAKVPNFASNLASLIVFAAKGLIVWKLALPMAAGQLLGGYLGAHVTVRRGRALVRAVTVAVSLALVARLSLRLTGIWP